MAAPTMQTVVDLGRFPLNDDDKDRYSDDLALTFANGAIQIAISRRPDLFIGQFSALPADLALVDDFPLARVYVQPVADYVTARLLSRDQEESVAATSDRFLGMLAAVMT